MFTVIPPGHKCLVIDDECFLVLCETKSVSVANAICKGLINTTTMVVPLEQTIDETLNYKLIQQGGLNSQVGNPKIGISNSAAPGKLSSKRIRYGLEIVDNVSERHLERKELAKKRLYGFNHLESGVIRYTARLTNFCLNEAFYSVIIRELDSCDVDNGFYTDAIKEYANIYKISASQAYQELSLMYNSTAINVIKMHAIWNKYVDKINTLDDIVEIHKTSVGYFEGEIFFGGPTE